MSQVDKARAFAERHRPGSPLLLYNIWDAGGAKAIAEAGAKAVATGSWSVAAAQGYPDGQAIPLDLLLRIAERIVATVDLPLTVDFEGGYAEAPEDLAANLARLIATGAVGINFEDQVVGGAQGCEGLYAPEVQCARIAALRRAAEAADLPFFVNARTDLFLKEKDRGKHGDLVSEALERAAAYAEAGASGFFVPGLVDPDLIGAVCEAAGLPVNVMMLSGAPDAQAPGRPRRRPHQPRPGPLRHGDEGPRRPLPGGRRRRVTRPGGGPGSPGATVRCLAGAASHQASACHRLEQPAFIRTRISCSNPMK